MADILIIGGGVSGLSAGIYGLLSGHSVTLCEKNAVAGGNLTGWYRGEYYIDMMRAWYFATALAKRYDDAVPYIEKGVMDVWTHNAAIRKAVESRRISAETKEYLKSLKRK